MSWRVLLGGVYSKPKGGWGDEEKAAKGTEEGQSGGRVYQSQIKKVFPREGRVPHIKLC